MGNRSTPIAIHRLRTLLALSAYLMGAGLWTSPRIFVEPNNAERYPCETCGCGCDGADACWTQCCCFTPQARLVWAIENGVEPPASVKFSPSERAAAEAIAHAAELPAGASCCATDPAECDDAATNAAESTRSPAWSSLRCKGLTPATGGFAWTAPAPGSVQLLTSAPPRESTCVLSVARLQSRPLDTPTPPPRLALV